MIRSSALPVRQAFILALATAITVAFALLATQPADAGINADSFSISSDAEVGDGASASVPLVVDPGDQSLAVYIVNVSYDSAVVEFNSCQSLANPPGSVAGTDCQKADGDDTIVALGGVIFPGSGLGLEDQTTLATMTFNAVGEIDDCSDLTIEVAANLGPDPDAAPVAPDISHGEICIVEDAGVQRTWGDVDCQDGVGTRDNQAILRNVLNVTALGQTEPCPDIGSQVTVDGTPRTWGDVDCQDGVGTRDNQAILRNVLNVTALGQTEPCPDIGTLVTVSE